MVVFLSIILSCAWLVILIFFILNIQNTLKAIATHNRKAKPGSAWLILIPVVGFIWLFMLSKKLSQSIESELKERDIPVSHNPTYTIGLVYAILNIVMFAARLFPLPIIYLLGGLSNLVFFIIYWVKIADYKTMIKEQRHHTAGHDLV